MDGRVAILGAGGWGQNLVRDFVMLLGADRVVVCDSRSDRLVEMAARHPGVHTVADAEAVWTDGTVRAAVIATDVVTHTPLALAAIAAGKHVFVEKPLALRAEDAERIRSAATARGVLLMVDHLLLFDPAVEEMLRLASDGSLGTIHAAYARRTNLGVVRTVENALWSLGPHDIAVMLRLFEATPERVFAHGGTFLQPEAGLQDMVMASLEFPDGRIGHLHLSWLDPQKVRQVTVIGGEAMVCIDDARAGERLMRYDRSVTMFEGVPRMEDRGAVALPIGDESPLVRACRAFLDLVDGKTAENRSDGMLGRRVVEVLERAQRSLDGGGVAA